MAIISEYRSALEITTNNNTLHPLAKETRASFEKANRHNTQIGLFWIKAHAGLEDNERAD